MAEVNFGSIIFVTREEREWLEGAVTVTAQYEAVGRIDPKYPELNKVLAEYEWFGITTRRTEAHDASGRELFEIVDRGHDAAGPAACALLQVFLQRWRPKAGVLAQWVEHLHGDIDEVCVAYVTAHAVHQLDIDAWVAETAERVGVEETL